jgi:cation transport ATPase
MSPEESADPDSDGTQTPTHAENLARCAVLKERNARLREEYRDLAADLDRMEADVDQNEETIRQLRARADAARKRLDARRATVDKPRRRSLWPWAIPIAMGIMITGNVLLAVSDYIPANLHAKGTSFALIMTAYFITGLAFFRSVRTKSLR